MKKIVAAWIEQILEFPTKLEYLAYIESLKKARFSVKQKVLLAISTLGI